MSVVSGAFVPLCTKSVDSASDRIGFFGVLLQINKHVDVIQHILGLSKKYRLNGLLGQILTTMTTLF